MPSGAVATRRGREPRPMFTSLICPVFGSSLPIRLSPMRQNQTLPALSSARPYGPPEDGYSLIAPVFVSMLATLSPLCIVNQMVLWSSVITSVCGPPPPDGVLNSVILPVAGSSLPIVPLPLPVVHTMPCRSTSSPCGRWPDGRSHSLKLVVLGSKRATLLPVITAM